MAQAIVDGGRTDGELLVAQWLRKAEDTCFIDPRTKGEMKEFLG